MNFTADLVAKELYKIESMKNHVLRTYSSSREDIFNIKIKEMPEYSVLYKMLYDRDILDEYTYNRTNNEILAANISDDIDRKQDLQAAKFQVEYYFGQTNYLSDDYLRGMEDAEGWINLQRINSFNNMRRMNLSLP